MSTTSSRPSPSLRSSLSWPLSPWQPSRSSSGDTGTRSSGDRPIERGTGMDIRVAGIAKEFGETAALRGVSLDVRAGELLALLGPSGSGKTTLLRVIAGLEIPDRGHVFFGEEDATGIPVQKRQVGFVFQHYALFRHLTVASNIAYGLRARSRARRPSDGEIRRRVGELLDLVQLSGLERRFPAQLSGGQGRLGGGGGPSPPRVPGARPRRVAGAGALAVEPRVLLLDEPFGALDAKVRKELRTWLRRLHDDVHVTTIFVTHDQEEAMDVAEQIIVMNDGKVEQSGGPRDLYEDPASEFVMSFVGPAHRIGEAWVRPHDIDIRHEPNGQTIEAMVDRIVHLGFEGRVELTPTAADQFSVQLTRDEVDQLELKEGQIVFVRPRSTRVFGPDGSGAKVTTQPEVA